jgi:hypothetical protein
MGVESWCVVFYYFGWVQLIKVTTRNHSLFNLEFLSEKPPISFFCPQVQFDQSAILDKLFCTLTII